MCMKNLILICFLLSFNTVLLGQEKTRPFKDGEWLKYKMSYSGFFKAGTAELTLKETDLNGKNYDNRRCSEHYKIHCYFRRDG